MKNGLIIYTNGDSAWYKDDLYHREDGPAIEWNDGSKVWCINGKCHREDGPAIEHYSGDKAWYLNGKQLPVNSQEDFIRYLKLKAFW